MGRPVQRPRCGDSFELGGLTLRNRLVMTPHLGRLPHRRLLDYLERRAIGGVAMAVVPAGELVYTASPYPPVISAGIATAELDLDEIRYHHTDPRFPETQVARVAAMLTDVAGALRRHGTVAVGQIHHPGPDQSWDGLQPTVGPSPLPSETTSRVPHELTDDEIHDVVEAYVVTAGVIVGSGMQGVELHAGHGYLLNRFLSPRYNQRSDQYGGSPQARARLLITLLDRIRDRVGAGPLIGVRLPAPEEVEGGLTQQDVVDIARAIGPRATYLNLSLGNHLGPRAGRPATPYTTPWLVGQNLLGATGAAIREAVETPVVLTGRVTTMRQAEDLLAAGAADLVGSARAYIADPDFARWLAEGRADRIARCIGCNECTAVPMSCPVNPEAGRERRFAAAPASERRRLVVVGAGPAGAELAVRAAGRGHHVTLLDTADQVGGTLGVLAATEVLAPWSSLLARLRSRVAASEVDFRAGLVATRDELVALDPDAVVVATGSRPRPAGFATDAATYDDVDVLAGRVFLPPGPVVVVGGVEPHLGPLLVAEELRRRGAIAVTLVTEHPTAGPAVEPRTAALLLGGLLRGGVRLEPMQRVLSWTDGAVRTEHLYSGARGRLEAASVVVAHGRLARSELAHDLAPLVATYVVGDALAPRRLAHAVLEGARFAMAL